MKEGQTGKYGVWLSECCTDRHRQHARRGLDGSAAAAAAAEEWNNTSHFVEAGTAAGAIQKQQRQALHILLYYVLLALFVFQFFIHGYLQDHFHIPERTRNLLYGNICLSGIPRRLPKLSTVPAANID